MGSCISRCNPNRNPHEETNDLVLDKLVIISQAPISPFPLSSKSPISNSSFSSSCATSKSTNSASLSSSSSSYSSSSIICSKEKSFSNDFLRSCLRENPHIICNIDPFNLGLDQKLVPNKVCAQNLNPSATKPNVAPIRQSIPKKIARANSPTLARQKSCRSEILERANTPSRTTRSPSPSRRFNGDNYNYNFKGGLVDALKEKSALVNKGSFVNYTRNDNLGPASPNNILTRNRENMRNKETCTRHNGSKIDETAVGEGLVNEDSKSLPLEDIDNPLMALDCFIFL